MKKIWLDTDIGNDLDDAVALAYLLTQPDCHLLGVSTVTGQPVERARIVDMLCKKAGKNIPIYPGIEAPLLTEQKQPLASQAKRVHEPAPAFPQNRAITAMYEAIKENPHEVILLAVGPLTNVALLLATYPDVPGLLKEMVLMCGDFFGRAPYRCETEWNAFCDPYAAAMVFNAKNLPMRVIGLDVTAHVLMQEAEVRRRFTSPLLKAVFDIGGFGEERTCLYYHDPLAAVSIFHPEVMTYQKGRISIELAPGRTFGRSYFDASPDGCHEAAETVDIPLFYERYFQYL